MCCVICSVSAVLYCINLCFSSVSNYLKIRKEQSDFFHTFQVSESTMSGFSASILLCIIAAYQPSHFEQPNMWIYGIRIEALCLYIGLNYLHCNLANVCALFIDAFNLY